MVCPACGCVRPRTGAIIVGTIDTIVGTVGIGMTCLVLYDNRIRERDSKFLEPPGEALDAHINNLNAAFWYVALSWLFPATVTFFLGVMIIFSAIMNHFCLATICIVINMMLIMGSIAIFFIMMVFSTPWIITIPVIFAAGLQIYFLWIVQDYRHTELKPILRYS
ncbi:unnamed protein product [Allacma fusca]|uniref:Uncharacterized protein n=1 Tax=Allacma fusca TaxID=39272 RepID=A0A8J2P4Y8_9HEXA|nr:unnamed protein product [Allacma fusca]